MGISCYYQTLKAILEKAGENIVIFLPFSAATQDHAFILHWKGYCYTKVRLTNRKYIMWIYTLGAYMMGGVNIEKQNNCSSQVRHTKSQKE